MISAALLATALGAGLWLLPIRTWFSPAPTTFGWPAELTIAAGSGTRGNINGPTSRARFSDPFAIAIDRAGTLYVADAGDTNRIRKIDPTGQVTTLPGAFDTPSGIALDHAGDILVADTGDNAIRRISPTGAVTTLAGDGRTGFRDGPASQAQFNGPIGLAIDKDGTVYVADTYNDRIRLITPDGQVRTLAGGGSPGFADGQGTAASFNTPCGLAIDRDGALLVADTGNDAIRKVTKQGAVSTVARSDPNDGAAVLAAPTGLAVTWDGFVYISSFHGGRILQMSPSGALRVLAGRDAAVPGNAALRFATPAGLALDRAGALYVADASSYSIRKLTPRPADSPTTSVPEPEAAPPALARAPTVPWPLKPQDAWHEVVGDLGEVRGSYAGESRDHLHAGLDIHADVGEAALAIANETVSDPLPDWNLDGLTEGLRVDTVTYIHIRVGRTATGTPLDPARFQLLRDATGRLTAVRVKRGTRFRVGDPLGTINRMAHVHLELGPPGGKVNALALRFPGLTDHVAPHIDTVQVFDPSGQALSTKSQGRLVITANAGPYSIVVDAWDQVDRNEPRRRLGLYRAGFQILHADGSPVTGFEEPQVNLLFDRLPPQTDAAKITYADASGDAVHSAQPTRFLYVVTNRVRHGSAEVGGWRPTGLKPGDYIIRILAADYAGNQALANRDLPITIR
jgi:sugar lactone lactonase YvrE